MVDGAADVDESMITALGLAIPLVIAISTSLGAQNGLLMKDRLALERARDLDRVISIQWVRSPEVLRECPEWQPLSAHRIRSSLP